MNNDLYCWGRNNTGQLGLNDTSDRWVPVKVDSQWAMVDAGLSHTCGIRQVDTENQMHCWGDNIRGQIGNGGDPGIDFLSPQRVGSQIDWEAVSVSNIGSSCGIRLNGGDRQVLCWGDGRDGVLGNGSLENAFSPSLADNNGAWTELSLYGRHACGRKGNALYCWGSGDSGQIGDGHAWQTSPVSAVLPPTE